MTTTDDDDSKKEPFLLHLCCAPCAPHPLRELKKEFDLTLFYYNPNIHPEAEYLARLDEVKKLAEIEKLPLIVGEYRHEKWFEMTKGLEDEPERGERCRLCISERLEVSARKAKELGIGRFGAVLSVSPHKDVYMINEAGKRAGSAGGVEFYEANFKKKEGFKISSKISRELGFERQDYCGCAYSLRDRDKRQQKS
jgi:predicted adenine nucleotide alpha hydrolase (AANH) superfamily ATPase